MPISGSKQVLTVSDTCNVRGTTHVLWRQGLTDETAADRCRLISVRMAPRHCGLWRYAQEQENLPVVLPLPAAFHRDSGETSAPNTRRNQPGLVQKRRWIDGYRRGENLTTRPHREETSRTRTRHSSTVAVLEPKRSSAASASRARRTVTSTASRSWISARSSGEPTESALRSLWEVSEVTHDPDRGCGRMGLSRWSAQL